MEGADGLSDGSDENAVSVVRKEVPMPTQADVDVIMRGRYRRAQTQQDPINKV